MCLITGAHSYLTSVLQVLPFNEPSGVVVRFWSLRADDHGSSLFFVKVFCSSSKEDFNTNLVLFFNSDTTKMIQHK